MTERTLVLVKPDGVGRKLIGEVLSRIERKGLDIVALELRTVERGPSTTAASTWPDVMNSSSDAKNGLPSCSA